MHPGIGCGGRGVPNARKPPGRGTVFFSFLSLSHWTDFASTSAPDLNTFKTNNNNNQTKTLTLCLAPPPTPHWPHLKLGKKKSSYSHSGAFRQKSSSVLTKRFLRRDSEQSSSSGWPQYRTLPHSLSPFLAYHYSTHQPFSHVCFVPMATLPTPRI